MFSHMLNSKCSLHFSDIIVIGLLFRERNLKQKGPKYVREELSNKSGRIKAVRTKTSGPATDDSRWGAGFREMGEESNSAMKRDEERADEVARKDSGEE